MILPLLLLGGLLARYECARCHAGAGEPPALEKRCVGCHQAILGGTFDAEPAVLARWRGRLASLNAAPDLSGATRLRRAWVASFLLDPRDVRPALPATMPRLAIAPEEAEAIARELVPVERPDVAFAPSEEGARLFERLSCGSCHALVRPASLATSALAPDLRHTRERMQSGALVAFLLDPPPSMPSFALTEDEARALAAYVWTAPLPPAAEVKAWKRLPVLKRRVAFDEVNARVFRRTCWHCHSSPEYAMGDGGPGNTGGFGFPARGLDLASYESASSGAIGDDGRRRSIFREGPDGTPVLVAHLLARASEERGAPVEGVRGMPLGLPALAPEQVQLVESWIAQGRPR